ncbi:MAG: hypothetical protein ACRENE_05640 [Polyangiaceae bacterium]
MRSTFLSIVIAAGTLSAGVAGSFVTASCSSSTSGGSSSSGGGDDGGSSSGSSSGVSSSGGSGGSGSGCVAYQNDADTTTPVVSFSKDVLPLFEHSCGLSTSCHYDPSAVKTLGIYLGCDITTPSTSCTQKNPGPEVYRDLVGSLPAAGADGGADGGVEGGAEGGGAEGGVDGGGGPLKALEDPMPYVTPGDPSNSYIMRKLDGDTCKLTDCIAGNVAVLSAMNSPDSGLTPNWCGQQMPLNGLPIPSIQSSTSTDGVPSTPACGGSTDCSKVTAYSRDTIRNWIAQGALNN